MYKRAKLDLRSTNDYLTGASTPVASEVVAAVTDMRWFVESARNYVLHGLSLDEMCDLNADVAFSLSRNQVRKGLCINGVAR